jgi:hypothetical protein
LTSWPRSRIRGRSAVAGTRWPGYRRLALDAGHAVRVRLVITIYGKTVRGAKGKKGKAPHLVAALAHGIGAVLGQVAVDEKSLVTVRRSWATWAAPPNSIQDGASSLDRAAGMPAVVGAHRRDGGDGSPGQLLELPVQRGHVCRARMACAVSCCVCIASIVITAPNGKKTVEVVCLITSDHGASPETLAARIRGHWHIENKLHRVRDVTYQEDKSW